MSTIASGAHRLTGMGMVGGIFIYNLIGLGLLGMASFVCDPMVFMEWLKGHSILLWCTKCLTSYCVFYHLSGGLRHIVLFCFYF